MSDVSLDTVLACPSLPSLPSVAVEVLELTREENVKLSDIERVVQNDPALVGKILKTVNSSYYGLSKPCPTIGRALTYLGLNTVKSLVLGFSLVDLTRRDGGIDFDDFWQRCLFSAAAARRIATTIGSCDPEEAFIAALMQDIGMLALERSLGPTYGAVLDAAEGDHDRLPNAERESLGFDHAEAGARLGERWRLPEQLTLPIRHHHDRRPRPTAQQTLVDVVALAYHTCKVIHEDPQRGGLAQLERQGEEQLRVTGDEIREILINTAQDASELSRLFKVSLASAPNITALLAEAEDARLAHHVRVQREAEQLLQANERLAEQAHTDALTQVANRKRFDEFLESSLADAQGSGGRVALIMADADKFKSFNDTYGHQAGDAVLVELAQRFEKTMGDRGLVCRYGGEEFAVIMPDASRIDAAEAAESLRLAVASTPMDLRGSKAGVDQVDVTSSFGVAVHEPSTAAVFNSPRMLLLAADKALYAAKEAGRNCVRVFRLRPRVDAA